MLHASISIVCLPPTCDLNRCARKHVSARLAIIRACCDPCHAPRRVVRQVACIRDCLRTQDLPSLTSFPRGYPARARALSLFGWDCLHLMRLPLTTYNAVPRNLCLPTTRLGLMITQRKLRGDLRLDHLTVMSTSSCVGDRSIWCVCVCVCVFVNVRVRLTVLVLCACARKRTDTNKVMPGLRR